MEYQSYIALREEMLTWVKGRLKPSRCTHTLGVEQTAVSLARQYGADAQEASFAALLHDNAKYLSPEEQYRIAARRYPEYHLTMEFSSVLHAFAGASIAEQRYPQLSRDVINAICFHTTGRPDMSLLEKIIYCADYIEPNRPEFDGLKEARRLVFASLDDGLLFILNRTCDYVATRGKPVHPLSLQTLAYYHMLITARNREKPEKEEGDGKER